MYRMNRTDHFFDYELEALNRSGRDIANRAIHGLLVWKVGSNDPITFAADGDRASEPLSRPRKLSRLAAKGEFR
jgi:phosphotransferase system HPr-like phosphotransfer protein